LNQSHILVKLFSLNSKLEARNPKWFDRPFDRLTVLSEVEGLTILSKVEGQYQNYKFQHAAQAPALRVTKTFQSLIGYLNIILSVLNFDGFVKSREFH